MATTTVVFGEQTLTARLGENTSAALSAATRAEAAQALAEAVSGPTYASIALGLAATTDGDTFAVDNGDGTVSIYLNDGGSEVEQRTLATSAALGASGGAALVGFQQSGAGAVLRDVLEKAREASISVDDFGALGDDITDDYAAIILAQNALVAQGGGELLFTRGKTYRVGTPIVMEPGVTYKGTGKSGINRVATASGAKLAPTGSALFTNSADTIAEVKFENLFFHSRPGSGAHIFDWTNAGVTAKIEFSGCVAVQENADKCVIIGNAGGGVFSLYWHDGEWQYLDGATVSPISLVSPTINSVVFERFWSTAAGEASPSGAYAMYIESANPAGPAINVILRDGVFEFSKHGAVKMLSCVQSGVENCTSYDLSATPTAPMFFIGDGASGPPSNNCWLRGVRSSTGTVGAPDAKLDCSVAGQGAFLVEACSFAVLDGGSATPGIVIMGGDITAFQNISYTRLVGSATLDLTFGTSDAGGRTHSIWNGYPGNTNGHLNFSVNGVRYGSVAPSGALHWSGPASNPNFYIDPSNGEMRTKQPLYPPDGAGAFQSGTSIIAGAGVPGAGLGIDGQFYFRSDGGGAGTTHLYFKTGGAWIAIA